MKIPVIISLLALGASSALAAGPTLPFQKKEILGKRDYVLNPERSRNKVKKNADAQSTVLFENFEEWDGNNQSWSPEGWTFLHKTVPTDKVPTSTGGTIDHPGWRVYGPDPYDMVNYPSNTFIYFLYETPADEWFISPEFTVGESMVLQADIYNGGVYYFDYEVVDEWLDHTITNITKKSDFKVHISTDGGANWTEIFSMADDILARDIKQSHELSEIMGWETVTVDLKDYVGDTAKIAFQVVGSECGQSQGVDNILVGYPTIEVSYGRPDGALFYGVTHPDVNMFGSFMVVPVFEPVTFPNTSDNLFDVSYSWSYDHTDGTQTSTDDDLTVVYGTNHESEETSRNNIYEMPTLTGSGELLTSTSFTAPGFVQAGGKGEYQATIHEDDGTSYSVILDFGLLNACPFAEGTSTYADMTTPYFGYNNENDRYWSVYKFPEYKFDYSIDWGAGLPEQDWMTLERIGNIYYTSDAPLAINAIRLPAFGRGFGANGTFSRGTKLTAEIYLLGDDMKIPAEPEYTAVCTESDIDVFDRDATNHILHFNFQFDSPVVLSKKDGKAYLVAITGFNDAEHISYFSPEMTAVDNPDGLELGWYQTRLNWGGYEILQWNSVYDHMSKTDSFGKTPEMPGEQKRTFCIQLDGAYAWLVSDTDEVTVNKDATVTVDLDSYYDGKDIEVEGLPAWLKATVSGRYGNAKLALTALETTNDVAEITLTAPGVSKKLTVTAGTGSSAIGGIEADREGEAEYFNLQGVKVANPQPGQILIRIVDGKATKVVI